MLNGACISPETYVYHAEVAILYMICWFAPNPRHTEAQRSVIATIPAFQASLAGFAHRMRSPWLVLGYNWKSKVGVVSVTNYLVIRQIPRVLCEILI